MALRIPLIEPITVTDATLYLTSNWISPSVISLLVVYAAINDLQNKSREERFSVSEHVKPFRYLELPTPL